MHKKLLSCLITIVVLQISAGTTMLYGAGAEVHNTAEKITGTWASAGTDIIIGPNAQITVNGDWFITANKIYIHPTATISGTGTIHVMSPSTYGNPAGQTLLDAGGVTIQCKLSIENSGTVTLNSINPAADYAASGITDPGGAGTNDLVIGSTLNFNNPGASVFLSNSNVIFNSGSGGGPLATYLDLNTAGFASDPAPGPAYSAYLVTNGTGTVTKRSVGTSATFTFPVGQSAPITTVGPWDYTPIDVQNQIGVVRDFTVQVKTYLNSGATESNITTGIDRTWQVTSNVAGAATLSQTHNSVSNSAGNSTNGSSFSNVAAFVTQQTSVGQWDITATSNGLGGPGPSSHISNPNRTIPTLTSDPTSYFSKSSDTLNSLSQFIAVSPKTILRGAWLSGTTMSTTLRTLGYIPLTQPYNDAILAYPGSESVASIPANVTDWVLVELRNSATPATIVARRAAFIKNNGTIVDLDGASPVSFRGVSAGSYFVSIRHRNHLAVRSAAAQTFVDNNTTVYDFTTAQSQAYQNPSFPGNTAMTALAGGAFGMWCGNTNNTASGSTQVKYTGPSNDSGPILTLLGGDYNFIYDFAHVGIPIYRREDVNLSGVVRFTGPGNDPSFMLLNSLSSDYNKIINQHL